MLGLTVFLAWLGIYSGGLHSPGVVMGKLAGGFTLLGLLGWMTLRHAKPRANAPAITKTWTTAALAWFEVQLMTDCHGSYLPGDQRSKAFNLSGSHEIGPTGLALGGSELADIHKLHRINAVITAFAIFMAGFSALRAKLGWNEMLVLGLTAAEFSVGIAAIVTDIPIGVATAHNWVAAMLLLALLRLYVLCNNRQALL